MKTKRTHLKIRDLLEGHNQGSGYGLYCHEVRTPAFHRRNPDPYGSLKRLDEALVGQASVLGWDAQRLHEFMDSRDGRHLGDDLAQLIDLASDDDFNLAQKINKAMKRAEAWLGKETA